MVRPAWVMMSQSACLQAAAELGCSGSGLQGQLCQIATEPVRQAVMPVMWPASAQSLWKATSHRHVVHVLSGFQKAEAEQGDRSTAHQPSRQDKRSRLLQPAWLTRRLIQQLML